MSTSLEVPTPHRFTVDDYYRMGELLEPGGPRTELLDGEVIDMTPIGSRHAACVDRTAEMFYRFAGSTLQVRVQNPIRLDEYSEPQPDLALVRARDDHYAYAHPEPADVLLVVEVADTSGVYDRNQKLKAYAWAGVPEAWLIVLNSGTVEVHHEPGRDGYGRVDIFRRGETVQSATLPQLAAPADSLLV